jgi:hypothetical protein
MVVVVDCDIYTLDALVDNGANVNVISFDSFPRPKHHSPWSVHQEERLIETAPISLAHGSEQACQTVGQAIFNVNIGSFAHRLPVSIVNGLTRDLFLGIPWMYKYRPYIDWEEYSLSWKIKGHHRNDMHYKVFAESRPSQQLLEELDAPELDIVQVNEHAFVRSLHVTDVADAGEIYITQISIIGKSESTRQNGWEGELSSGGRNVSAEKTSRKS